MNMRTFFVRKTIGFIVIGALVVLGYWFVNRGADDGMVYDENASVPQGWETYSNPDFGFSIAYDPAINMDEDSETVRFYGLGPTQSTGTEIYDGFALVLHRAELTGTLDEYVAELTKHLQEVETPVHDVVIDGVPAKSFTGTGLGTFTFFIIPRGDQVLEIAYLNADPGNLGFQEKIDYMLASLKLLVAR